MMPRILVADDDPGMLSLVAEALEQRGAKVVRAANGVELIERLANDGPFDLIVTDIVMPWMSGLQVANRARTAGLRTPLIIITGIKDPLLEQKIAALGGDARLLRKPFGLDDLEQAVGSLIDGAEPGATPSGL